MKQVNDLEIKVTVCVLTYNQEKYIELCLESIIKQKTDFLFEVLVHDDGSTDGTVTIIKKYASMYPNVIRPILQSENQYSKVKSISQIYQKFLYPEARGKYIAFCEGDDYFFDSYKLKKQVDVLEANPNCHMCTHYVQCVNETGNNLDWGYPLHEIKSGAINSNDFLKGLTDGYFFHTSSFMCRVNDIKLLVTNLPEYYNICSVDDVPLLLYFGQLGDCYYINQCLSCYRRNSEGSWTKKQKSNIDKIISHKWKMIEMYKKYDSFTNGKYSYLVNHWIDNERFMIAELTHDFREMGKGKYKVFLQSRGIKYNIKVLIAGVIQLLGGKLK